ncbi:Transcriptional regulator, IclR family [Serinicoccus hydrothermalis]|uniref:Transcriptional regulator, IclR family n=1 Tax=Serinicoccus hydrothermalis TaxID=1758689 RepID=A0A1B1NE80_9MICO|nr:IclR family transcriptional regulator [Serinicoccus hydrothermalis]ANS79748.1 Transcriptional regulator, IclR family [Serinicoccus hydrothermalis]
MRNDDDSNGASVQSVDRALTILEILAKVGEAGIGEVATTLGVHKSTASRLVSTLAAHDLVELTGERGRARLGVGVLRLAGSTSARLDLVQEARPVCQELAAETNETVNIAVLGGRSALYIDQVIGPSTITSHNWVGQHIPLHATSNGRVLVSELSPRERRATWGELTAYTEGTVTDPDELDRLVDAARERGCAVVRDELDVGLTAVAAPVRNAHGEICASMSVSGPSFRMDPERVEEVVPVLVAAAAEVSSRLGWHQEPVGLTAAT